MGRWKTAALLVVPGLLAACSESPSGPTPLLEELPRALTAAEQEVISASNRFAFGLLREVDRADAGGNVFLSPVSASMALGMTMNGARSETFSEMRSTLGFDDLELQEINESYRSLLDLLLELDPRVDTRIANSIWYRKTYPFDQSFFDVVHDYFSAEATGLDFVPSDRTRINDWVSRATAGKIPEIVDEIRPEHVMFLINAIYFKGSWTHRFDPKMTVDDRFQLGDGATTPVRMMNRHGAYGYTATPMFQAVDLPYGNGAFSMTILLPAEGTEVDDLVATLDADRWREMTAALRPRDLHLSLPRFRIEYKEELNDALKALGINAAFTPGAADFSGMSSTSGKGLVISRVVQKSFVEVNEEGTEATAATLVEIVETSMPPGIRVDRPFLFAIRERFSGTILFMGKIVDPS